MGVKVIKPGPQESSTLILLNVLLHPIASLYGIFTNIWLIYVGHAGEYTKNEWYVVWALDSMTPAASCVGTTAPR